MVWRRRDEINDGVVREKTLDQIPGSNLALPGPGTANIFISFNSRLGERQRINEVVLGNSQVKPKQHVQNSSFTCKTAPARATRALCALITGQ